MLSKHTALRKATINPCAALSTRSPWSPSFTHHTFYQHLPGRGKTKKRAPVVVMRKLLPAVFGIVKHHPFDGSKFYARTPEAISL